MRLSVEYKLKEPFLPKDYRSGFMSLIKEAIAKSTKPELKEDYYDKHTLKPFTFSTYFPEMRGNAGENFEVGTKVKLNFSTSSVELATHLYNGFLKLRSFPIFQNTLYFERVTQRRQEKIRSEEVVFKTASPILVSNLGRSNWFLLPEQEGFLEGLKFAVSEISKEFLRRTLEVNLEFTPVSIKKKVIRHYGMDRSSFTGIFRLKSDVEILQLIYDVGLGVRRNQGFGMLEVVKQEGV